MSPAELWLRCETCGILCGSSFLLGLHERLAHGPKPKFKFEPANSGVVEEDEKPRASKWKKRNIT